VTGGVARLTIDSAGAVTIPGNVSITGDLNVTGAQNSNIALIVALG
jgi:UDP-N-acetylglucosamine enolpyruvyl transferase